MTLGLSVIDNLGLNLYSNMPAVVAEVVANAWDADAEHVKISVDLVRQRVTILDDGHGMDDAAVNKKYLVVGRHRRELEPVRTAEHDRHVMGRKGIGKLSLFSIAKTIEVVSRRPGEPASALRLESDQIRAAAQADASYHPRPLDRKLGHARGTRIELTDLKKRMTKATVLALRRRLARRFSVIGPAHDFEVSVNDDPIGLDDRDYYKSIEFLWSIGKVGKEYEKLCARATHKRSLSGAIEGTKYEVTGWVGTFDERRNIEEEDNTLSVLAWGKLVHEDLLESLRVGGIYARYLIGELNADFVDIDTRPDIATTDRQHLKEDDVRFEKLTAFVRELLKDVERDWNEWRSRNALVKALEVPSVKSWYDELPGAHRKAAEQLFGKIGRLPIKDDGTRREIYRHGILAFERLRFRNALDSLEKLEGPEGFDMLEAVFGDIADLEAIYYHDIARGRFEVLQKFVGIAERDKERVIQKYLFDNIWLLDPSWERASTNLRIEEVATKEFKKIDAKLTPEEKRARFDLKYRTAAGKHIIIELKRYGTTVDLYDLMKQLQKYRTALRKVLDARFPDEPQEIECVLVLGHVFSGATRAEGTRHLKEISARWTTYDTLIEDSIRSYRDYIEAREKVSKLTKILDEIAGKA